MRGPLVLVLLLALVGWAWAQPTWRSPLRDRLFGLRGSHRTRLPEVDISCDVCLAFSEIFHLGIAANWTETKILAKAAALCASVPGFDFAADFCTGVVADRFGPVVYQAVVHTQGSTARRLCEYVHLCPSSSNSTQLSSPRRTSPSAPPARRSRKTHRSGTTKRYVAQLSDIHFDQYYSAGSSRASPGYSLGCRAEFGTTPPVAGPFGAYGAPQSEWGCDIPLAMLQNAFSVRLLKVSSNLLTKRDFVAHDIWQNNWTEIRSETATVTSALRKALPASVRDKVFFVLGNHDMMPADQFKLPQANSRTNTQDLLNAYASTYDGGWGGRRSWAVLTMQRSFGYLGADVASSIASGGYYTTLLEPGLRLVALNSQYGDMINFWLYAGSVGPDQMAWFNATLAAAREAGELLIVAAHMPCVRGSGLHDFYCEEFADALRPYADMVVLLVGGHTHHDSWVTFTDLGVDLVNYVTPSLTTFSFKNPGMRVFTLVDNEVTQVDTYYANMGDGTHAPQWLLEYSMPEAYNMTDLSASSFNALSRQLLNDDGRFHQYLKYYQCSLAAAVPGHAACDTHECRVQQYCSLVSPLSTLYNQCIIDNNNGSGVER